MSQGYYVKWNISILHIISYYANTVILWLPEITGIIQRETHSTDRVWIILEGKRGTRVWDCQFLCCCCYSHVRLFSTTWTSACQASLSFTMFQTLLKLIFIELMMLSNLIILSCLLLLLPSVCNSIRVFSSESALRIRWPKYCSFSISLSSEYSGLIFFRIDWLHFLAGQLFATLWTEDRQAPLSMGFSRQAYWSELPALLQGIFWTKGLNLHLLCLLLWEEVLYHYRHLEKYLAVQESFNSLL